MTFSAHLRKVPLMGRRILMISMVAAGHVMPWVGLAGELVRRGHQVSYMTTDDFAAPLNEVGVEVVPFATTAEPSSSPNEYASPFDQLMWGLKENSAIADAAKTQFADDPPDLVLYDTTAFYAGRVLSRGWRRPAIMLSATFAEGPHYSVTQDITSRSPQETDNAPALSEFMIEMARFIAAHAADIKVTDQLLGSPEALTIVNMPREFQIRGETFDERWLFAGPFLDARAFQGQWEPPGDNPVLLVSLGTMNYVGQLAFLQTCVSAFSGLDWHVVISTGQQLDPADLGPLPPNVEAHQRVPQLAILKKAKLFVSHGGMGGTMEALSAGVPILAFPQLPEHTIGADRIAELGLGRRGTPDMDAGELRAAVLEVAADASVARAVAEMGEHIKKAGGVPRAADEVEAQLRTSADQPS
jgi:MGT family glycosyltransferase